MQMDDIVENCEPEAIKFDVVAQFDVDVVMTKIAMTERNLRL